MLVIDGHAAVRTALPRALTPIGCETATAASGEEALRRVKDSPAPFVLVIMDLVLPRTDGLQLLGQLRQEAPASPWILVLGSLQDPDAIQEVLDLGAGDYIAKPFDLDVLLYKVCALLREPTPALFHWAPLRGRTVVTLEGHRATATAVSEAGLVVELPVGSSPPEGRIVGMESDFFDEPLGRWRRGRGRVMSVTRGRTKCVVELGFIALSEPQLHRIRRFTVAH